MKRAEFGSPSGAATLGVRLRSAAAGLVGRRESSEIAYAVVVCCASRPKIWDNRWLSFPSPTPRRAREGAAGSSGRPVSRWVCGWRL
jgi:hypothetical protein